ncbi:MAG: hypothetical protein AAFZ15_13580 [Bacteroidota bacterium]
MGKQITTGHVNQVMNEEVSNPTNVPALSEAENLLSVKRNQIFIEDDSFVANPLLLLGNILEIRKMDGECPEKFNAADSVPEFSIVPLQDFVVDEASILKQPVKRQSILVDQKLSLQLSFLSYLSTQLDHESVFNTMVFDQAAGRIKTSDPSWSKSVNTWKEQHQALLEDEDICYLLAVTGMVQKNVIRKKYTKFSAGAKGGGWGVNFNGSLHTSNDDYALDFRFGLSVGVIKRPKVIYRGEKDEGLKGIDIPTEREMNLFKSISTVIRK